MSAFENYPRVTPFLWFEANAEEAVDFYLSIFKNSRRLGELRNADDTSGPKGKILTISFELEGQVITALNGGPYFQFNEAVSFVVNCETQAEVDEMWTQLSEGGQEVQCGWLKDKYGLSWQIVPSVLIEMLKDPGPERKERVTKAMLQMKKLDIAGLEAAYHAR